MGCIIEIKKTLRTFTAPIFSRVDNDQTNTEGIDFQLLQNIGVLNLFQLFISKNRKVMDRAVQFNGKVEGFDENINFPTRWEDFTNVLFNAKVWKVTGNKTDKIIFTGTPVILVGTLMLVIIAHCATTRAKVKYIRGYIRRVAFNLFPTPFTSYHWCIVPSNGGEVCTVAATKFEGVAPPTFYCNLHMIFGGIEC